MPSDSSTSMFGVLGDGIIGIFEKDINGDLFSGKSRCNRADKDFYQKLGTVISSEFHDAHNPKHSYHSPSESSMSQSFIDDLKEFDTFDYEQYKLLEEINNIEDRYEIGSTISHGQVSLCRKGFHRVANIHCVIKSVKK